jgi:2-oxo-4-hydroxy-4-carboxy-5-ureidoimidazoline decarboxylase
VSTSPAYEADDDISRFNSLDERAARTVLESCLAVPRWVDAVLAGRPYAAPEDLLHHAGLVAGTLTDTEVAAALARHPRIGEAADEGHDGELSASEQSGVDSGNPAVAAALRTANAEYERRFGRIFLIRAAGRTSADVLSELHRRLQNSDETEAAEVVGQLSEIALDRLQRVIGT